MSQDRRPAATGSSARAPLVLSTLLLIGALLPACQNTDEILKPGEIDANVVEAFYVPDSVFVENPIELNGEAIEREWGGPLSEDLPYYQIRLSSEDGEGEPGDPKYVSVKAVYTDSDIYFLFRWTDTKPDVFQDVLFYTGPSYPEGFGCFPPLVDPENWSFEGRIPEVDSPGDPSPVHDEDRFVAQFRIPGEPAGRRDVWQWLSTRTNQTRDLYDRQENPNFPLRGVPAYLEDGILDPEFGLFFDPGTPTWRRNTVPGTAVPLQVYRQDDDPFFEPDDPTTCFNEFGERCLTNNGLPLYYIWREDLLQRIEPFSACDTTNWVPVVDAEPRLWRTGDFVSAYWYTYPEVDGPDPEDGSRADVHGKGLWDEGVWTLEVGRRLNTGDTANDLRFTGIPGETVPFTLQVYDNSGRVYWGSGEQLLRFGPKEQGRPTAATPGEEGR